MLLSSDWANPSKSFVPEEKSLVERVLKADWSFWIVWAIILFTIWFGSFLISAGDFVSGATFFGVALISYYLLGKSSE